MVKALLKVRTAHAILRIKEKYILQLRDNSPDIAASGQWSLFGGRIKQGETALKAVKREIFEELCIKPEFRFLWREDYYYDFVKGNVRTWFFVAKVDQIWSMHRLKEGQAAKAFLFNQLESLDIPLIIRKSLTRFHSEGN